MSTAEAEYIAVTTSIQTSNTIHNMMVQTTLWVPKPATIKTDNQATVVIVNKSHGTKRRNFIDLRHHFIRQKLMEGRETVTHVPAADQKADMHTKPLKRIEFERQCAKLKI